MNGGEDYELLFTVPLADREKIEKLEGVSMIGYITRPELGAYLVSRDGNELEIRAQGWNAFPKSDADQTTPKTDENSLSPESK